MNTVNTYRTDKFTIRNYNAHIKTVKGRPNICNTEKYLQNRRTLEKRLIIRKKNQQKISQALSGNFLFFSAAKCNCKIFSSSFP